MSPFNLFPNEILEYILCELPAKEILACHTTCRRIKQLVDSSTELQLILELAVEGFILPRNWRSLDKVTQSSAPLDNPSSRTAAQILSDFRQRREGWKTLTHRSLVTASYTTAELSKQFIDGILGEVSRNRSQDADVTLCRVFWNPHSPDSEDDIYYPRPVKGANDSITWDVSQDLLVVFNGGMSNWDGTISLYSLSSDSPHQLAQQSPIAISEPGYQRYSSLQFWDARVCGRFLIIHYATSSQNLMVVYDWMTGQQTCRERNAHSFAILTDELVLVLSHTTQGSIPSSECSSLRVISLCDGRFHCVLRLPFSKSIDYPSFLDDSFHSPQLHTTSCPYIYRPGNDRIVVIQARYDDDLRDDTIHVVISVKHILSHIPVQSSAAATSEIISDASAGETSDAQLPNHLPVTPIDWPTWGPGATRWFIGDFDSATVCGSRLLFTRTAEHPVALLFDFNQGALARHLYQHTKECETEKTESGNNEVAITTIAALDEKGSKRKGRSGMKGTVVRGRRTVAKATPSAIIRLLMAVTKPRKQRLVMEEWVVRTDYYLADKSDLEDEEEPLLMEVRSRLPFRAVSKKLGDDCNQDSIRLGVHEIIGESKNGDIFAFLF